VVAVSLASQVACMDDVWSGYLDLLEGQ